MADVAKNSKRALCLRHETATCHKTPRSCTCPGSRAPTSVLRTRRASRRTWCTKSVFDACLEHMRKWRPLFCLLENTYGMKFLHFGGPKPQTVNPKRFCILAGFCLCLLAGFCFATGCGVVVGFAVRCQPLKVQVQGRV